MLLVLWLFIKVVINPRLLFQNSMTLQLRWLFYYRTHTNVYSGAIKARTCSTSATSLWQVVARSTRPPQSSMRPTPACDPISSGTFRLGQNVQTPCPTARWPEPIRSVLCPGRPISSANMHRVWVAADSKRVCRSFSSGRVASGHLHPTTRH